MDESTWAPEIRELPRDQVLPGTDGVTVGEWLDLYAVRPAPQGYVFQQNVTYGTAGRAGRDLKAHVWRPLDTSRPRPGIVFVHGGGWAGGHPFFHVRHGHEMAARDWVAATISYRLSAEAPWPAALEDTKCAVRWMRANAAELGVDPDRIAVSGGSAGGHLSCMVALTPGQFEGTGGHEHVSSAVRSAAVWYPMTDMHAPGITNEEVTELRRAFLGSLGEDVIREASPITYVHRDAPPILSLAGDADQTTHVNMIREFHRVLDEHGVPNRLEIFEGKPHAWDLLPAGWEECFPYLVEWLEEHVTGQRKAPTRG